MARFLEATRRELIDGKGFILIKGLPVTEWNTYKTAVAYMGLGTHFGNLISQNGKGHVLGHIKNMGEDASQVGKIRSYRTNKGYNITSFSSTNHAFNNSEIVICSKIS